ncbi:MAG: DMT family transporter [Treponemataceae bacterium]
MSLSPTPKGAFALSGTILLFSTLEVVGKSLSGRIDPFQLTFLRFFIGGIVMFLALCVRREAAPPIRKLPGLFFLGVLNVGAAMNLLQLSLFLPGSRASTIALIFSCNPVFVVLIAGATGKEKLTLTKCVALALALLGMITVLFPGIRDGLRLDASALTALAASILFAVYTYLARSMSLSIGSLKMNAWSFLLGSLAVLPFLLIFHIPIVRFDPAVAPQVAYLAICVTGIAYFLYFKGLGYTGVGAGSTVFFFKPALAALFAFLYLRETPTFSFLVGTPLILVGIYLVLRKPIR